jgi:hypothetical protein
MRRSSIVTVVLTIALATSALAAPTLPGVNIRWDNCFADGGVMNKAFACDRNTGSDLAVLSLQLDTGMDHVSGVEIRISIKPAAAELPCVVGIPELGQLPDFQPQLPRHAHTP